MRAIWNRSQWVVRLLLASIVLLSASQAQATIIGLSDGTYDVTLTCSFTDCAPAGPLGPFVGTLTASGDAWFFTSRFSKRKRWDGHLEFQFFGFERGL